MNLIIDFFIAFMQFFLIILTYSFIEPLFLFVKTDIVKSEKIKGEIEGLKVLFVSDIHQGKLVSIERVKKIVKKINSQKPDIVLMGGDYITWGADVDRCFLELSKIKSKYGILGVMGNHEHKTKLYQEVANKMKLYDIKQLDNDAVDICIGNEKIRVGGVGDLLFDNQNINPLITGEKNIFRILLSHNPDYVETLKSEGYTQFIDLMLSGDTHGGQVTLFGLWTPFLRNKITRLHRTGIRVVDNTTLLVTNGAGVLGVPLRLFAPAQINVIILKAK